MIERYARQEFAGLFSLEAQYRRWLEVELAVLDALADAGTVPRAAVEEIRSRAVLDVDRILTIEATVRHDVVAFTQGISESVGPAARYLHYGLTSSDVVDTAWGMALREASDVLLADLDALRQVLARRAWQERGTAVVGRTHGIHAEPTSFGLKLALWHAELGRDRDRLERARAAVAVGKIAGAVGTYAELPPEIEEQALTALGLQRETVPTQIVQRDRHAEWLFSIAMVGATLEKIATEVRSLQRSEIRELEEPFGSGQKGSSAMPHKRNPVVAERVCGLARLLRGYLVAGLEDVALWHERDISHSSVERVALPDAALLADFLLRDMTWLVGGMKIDRENMERNIWRSGGLVFSQRVLLRLVETGLSREDAYAIVQGHAMAALGQGGDFRQALLSDPRVTERIPAADLAALFDVHGYLIHVDDILRRAGIAEEES